MEISGHSPSAIGSLVGLLRQRSRQSPDRLAFTYLSERNLGESPLTYEQLDAKARAIAVELIERGVAGSRAILLYPSGLDFIAAFFGCLYAGVVAVTAYPPRDNRHRERLELMIADSGATIALTTQTLHPQISEVLAPLQGISCLATDGVVLERGRQWQEPPIYRQSLAFLQYTSGSTSAPKGVMVSHGNLLYNLATMHEAFGFGPDSVSVSWLPIFHDMGLIQGILQPLFSGFPGYILSPVTFLLQPVRWLQA
ncbi:MAG: AMP-binding protein, partial [Cyanobacteria bacterium REEB65]|nr:AMP-binding protein [Cyanobacteria bacterium REEB65]